MICVIKADLFSQKRTQHHMDWNCLSTIDPIFGIYFRGIPFGYVSSWIQGTSHNMVGAHVQMSIMHRIALS